MNYNKSWLYGSKALCFRFAVLTAIVIVTVFSLVGAQQRTALLYVEYKSSFSNDAPIIVTQRSSARNVSSASDTSDSFASDPYTECMLNLEREVMTQDQIDEWDRNIVPVPYSVKIFDNSFWILAYLLDDRRSKGFQYSCNGVPGAKIVPYNEKFGKELFALRCPPSLNPQETTLSSFSSWNTTNNETIQQYDVKLYDACERKDIAQMAKNPLAPKIKIGVTACFIGDRNKVMEWAAYHHTIGVDHIWIYVNDEWDNARDLPSRPYITWVPWNFHVAPNSRVKVYRAFKFQVASMNDALFRAKRMGMDWIATIDVDEFVTVYHGAPPDEAGNLPLPQYFDKLGESDYASIQLNSISYGSNFTKEDSQKDLLIDYVYTKNVSGGLDKAPQYRYKQFLNVKLATGVATHYLIGKLSGNTLREKNSILRLTHYKEPNKGVHRSGKNGKNVIMKHTALRDNYRSAILADIDGK